MSGRMFQNKMAIQQDRLNLRKQGVVPVEIGPTRLHHPHSFVLKIRNDFFQKVWRRNKIRVKNSDQVAFGMLKAVL